MGSPIMQPSAVDGGLAAARLAGLHRFVPILEQAGDDNEVDAAIAKLDVVDSMGPGICTVGNIEASQPRAWALACTSTGGPQATQPASLITHRSTC